MISTKKILTIFLIFLITSTSCYSATLFPDDKELASSFSIDELGLKLDKKFVSYYKNEKTSNYTFYIKPMKWFLMTDRGKVELYLNCVKYAMAKDVESGENVYYVTSVRDVMIRSSIDGALLAVYNPEQGRTDLNFWDENLTNISKNLFFTRLYLKKNPSMPSYILYSYKNKVNAKFEDNSYKYVDFALNRGFEIEINKKGEIAGITLNNPPWIDKVDDEAVKLIRKTGPFDPIPKKYKKDKIKIYQVITIDTKELEK